MDNILSLKSTSVSILLSFGKYTVQIYQNYTYYWRLNPNALRGLVMLDCWLGLKAKPFFKKSRGVIILLLPVLYCTVSCIMFSAGFELPSLSFEQWSDGLILFILSENKQMWLQVPILNRENEERVQLESLQEDIKIVCLWIIDLFVLICSSIICSDSECILRLTACFFFQPSFLGPNKLSSINLWMNNAESRSSTHYDPHHNLLCVVAGCKRGRYFFLWFSSSYVSLLLLTEKLAVFVDGFTSYVQIYEHSWNLQL